MSESAPQTESTPRPPDSPNMMQLAQLGLRLLGIMFLVDGTSSIISQAAYDATITTNPEYYPIASSFLSRSYLYVGPGVYVFAGLYFMIDGSWVLRNIFASTKADMNVDDEMSLGG